MPATPPRLMANGTIRPSRFVRQDTTAPHKGLEGNANCKIIGVAQEGTNYPPLSDLVVGGNAAVAGEYFKLYGDGEECLLECGDTVTHGDYLKSDGVGRGVPILTVGTVLQRFGAIAEEDGAVGHLIRVAVLIGSERPAIT